jgi:hypothetical protein
MEVPQKTKNGNTVSCSDTDHWHVSEGVCIYLMARDVKHFFMCIWPTVLLPLKSFCLVDLPISSLGH